MPERGDPNPWRTVLLDDLAIRMEDFKKGQAVSRRYRKRRIGEFLKELDLAEARSTGLPKIFRAMRQNSFPEPVCESDEDRTWFPVGLPAHERSLLAPTQHVTRQDKSLINKEKGQYTPQDTLHVTPQDTLQDTVHVTDQDSDQDTDQDTVRDKSLINKEKSQYTEHVTVHVTDQDTDQVGDRVAVLTGGENPRMHADGEIATNSRRTGELTTDFTDEHG